jgi:Lon protease-like protein
VHPDLSDHQVPIPIFPLQDVVLLPHLSLPLHIFEPRYRKMVEDALSDRSLIGMVKLESPPAVGCVGDPPVRRTGCVGAMRDVVRLKNGRFNLRLEGRCRFEIVEETMRKPYRRARVRFLPDGDDGDCGEAVDAGVSLLLNLLRTNTRARGRKSPAPPDFAGSQSFGAKIHLLAAASRLLADETQELLELPEVRFRARRLEQMLRDRIDSRSWAECWRGLVPGEIVRN